MTMISIQFITDQINYYGPIFILIIGIPGCINSFITFTAPQLRQNSCAFYFLMATIFEFISITFGLISSFAFNLFGSNLIHTNRIYCKIRAYLVYVIPLIATYMVLLAAIDRYLLSSSQVNLRNYSRIKVAYWTTSAAVVIGFLSCSHVLVTYDLRPRCMGISSSAGIYDSIFVTFWLGLIPHVSMLIFGSLTWLNIRRSKRQIYAHPQIRPIIINQRQKRQLIIDRQLIAMMIVQVGLSSIFVCTFMITYSYYTLKPPMTTDERSIGLLIISVATLLFYTNYTKSFYVYILSSHLFRSVYIHQLKTILQFVFGRYIPVAFEQYLANNRDVMGRSIT